MTTPDLATPEILAAQAYGDRKHGPGTWPNVDPADHCLAAIGHITTHLRGKTLDESGGYHLAHAAARVRFALEMLATARGPSPLRLEGHAIQPGEREASSARRGYPPGYKPHNEHGRGWRVPGTNLSHWSAIWNEEAAIADAWRDHDSRKAKEAE